MTKLHTRGVFARPEGIVSPAFHICSTTGPMRFVSVGLLLKGSSGTTSISGKRSTMARTCRGQKLNLNLMQGDELVGSMAVMAYRNRLASSSISHDQHTAYLGVYDIQQDCELHIVLTSYLDERERRDLLDRSCWLGNYCCVCDTSISTTARRARRRQGALPFVARQTWAWGKGRTISLTACAGTLQSAFTSVYDRHDYRSKLHQLSDSSYKCWDQASICSCCRRFDILCNLDEFVCVGQSP